MYNDVNNYDDSACDLHHLVEINYIQGEFHHAYLLHLKPD